jgi:hypothetical protein
VPTATMEIKAEARYYCQRYYEDERSDDLSLIMKFGRKRLAMEMGIWNC